MKKLISVILIVSLFFIGCGVSKNIDGVERKPIGLISSVCKSGTFSDKVEYEPCWGNIIWGALLFETIIAPIYFYGFSCMNPVDVKK